MSEKYIPQEGDDVFVEYRNWSNTASYGKFKVTRVTKTRYSLDDGKTYQTKRLPEMVEVGSPKDKLWVLSNHLHHVDSPSGREISVLIRARKSIDNIRSLTTDSTNTIKTFKELDIDAINRSVEALNAAHRLAHKGFTDKEDNND